VNTKESESKEVESSQLGFWLPHGVKIRDFCKTWSTRYLSVKQVYESLTGSEWSDCNMAESSIAMLLEIEETLLHSVAVQAEESLHAGA